MTKPTLALGLGDPAGVGPELVAKVFSKEENRSLANIYICSRTTYLPISWCGVTR